MNEMATPKLMITTKTTETTTNKLLAMDVPVLALPDIAEVRNWPSLADADHTRSVASQTHMKFLDAKLYSLV